MNNFTKMNLISFCRTMGDPTRWRIVRLVSNHALCVCELADILDMPQSSVSSHVQVIRKAGLLESERREKWTYFRIRSCYLKILEDLDGHFAGSGDPVWNSDHIRTCERLAKRTSSCCPGPIRLATRAGEKAALPQ